MVRQAPYSLPGPYGKLAPYPIAVNRAPTSSDTGYQIGQIWVDVSVPTLPVVYILGNNASGEAFWESTSLAPVSPFVVDAAGNADYDTIQDALDAANAAGGGIVVLWPGVYTEDLTLYDKTQVVGCIGMGDTGDFQIIGSHTPPTSGGFVFRNLYLTDASSIFSSAAAGTAHLLVSDVRMGVTSGYSFDLANWTGIIENWDVNSDLGTNDGWLNNTGGGTLLAFQAGMGAGTGNAMTTSGTVVLGGCDVSCPVTFATGTDANIVDCEFSAPVTLANDSTGFASGCQFTGGATAAITMSSSGAWTVDLSSLDSSASPALAGAGAGAFSYGCLTFLDDATISGSLNLSGATVQAGPVSSLGDISLTSAAAKIQMNGGAATDFIGQATLSAGTKAVLNTNVTANDRILVTRADKNGSSALGTLEALIDPGVKFTINSYDAGASVETNDISIVNYFIVRQT